MPPTYPPRTRDFHLVGPSIDRRTTRAFVGTRVWVVQLDAGVYRFGSDPKLTGRLVVV